MIRKKVRGFNRRASKIMRYVRNMEYLKVLHKEANELSNEAVRYKKECDRLGIEYIPDKALPKELFEKINSMKEKLSKINQITLYESIISDLESGKISLKLKNGFKLYNDNNKEIKYNIINNKLCIQLKE